MYSPYNVPETVTELLAGAAVTLIPAVHCVGVALNLVDADALLVVLTIPVCSPYVIADTATVEVIVIATIRNSEIRIFIFFICFTPLVLDLYLHNEDTLAARKHE